MSIQWDERRWFLRVRYRWVLVALLLCTSCKPPAHSIVVGSKDFDESVLLGEIIAQHLERHNLAVERRLDSRDTQAAHEALVNGTVDIYVEYTGTAYAAVLGLSGQREPSRVLAEVSSAYRSRWDIEWLQPLGFENTFAVLMRREDAEVNGVRKLSDAVPYASGWRLAAGPEFMERPDGYRSLSETYGLHFAEEVVIMDLDETYYALDAGEIDIIVGNSTDARADKMKFVQLEDDLQFFPPYQAVPVIRGEVLKRYPDIGEVLAELAGALTEERMREVNADVHLEGYEPNAAASLFFGRGYIERCSHGVEIESEPST